MQFSFGDVLKEAIDMGNITERSRKCPVPIKGKIFRFLLEV
jgi:hypothetical protein